MKAGGGKSKGAQFERTVCKQLSEWVSNNEQSDLFWRSAMSGGRATQALKHGVKLRRQAGDITAVAPEGHMLTNTFYIELKHVADLNFTAFLLKGSGSLGKFWTTAQKHASTYNCQPMLIAKQNRLPTIVLVEPKSLSTFVDGKPIILTVAAEIWLYNDMLASYFNPPTPTRRKRRKKLAT